MIFWLIVPLQVEAAGLECCLDGDVQRRVQCVSSVGALRGLQAECGTPLFTSSGIGEPSPGAPHRETHRHAVAHQDLFGRREEALHPLLCSRVSCRELDATSFPVWCQR